MCWKSGNFSEMNGMNAAPIIPALQSILQNVRNHPTICQAGQSAKIQDFQNMGRSHSEWPLSNDFGVQSQRVQRKTSRTERYKKLVEELSTLWVENCCKNSNLYGELWGIMVTHGRSRYGPSTDECASAGVWVVYPNLGKVKPWILTVQSSKGVFDVGSHRLNCWMVKDCESNQKSKCFLRSTPPSLWLSNIWLFYAFLSNMGGLRNPQNWSFLED